MQEYMVWIWLGVLIIALMIEVFTNELISIWFVGGSLVAVILAVIPNIEWWIEFVVLIGVSLLLLGLLRPIVKRYFFKEPSKFNIDDIVGKKGLMLKEANGLTLGEVKIGDVTWNVMPQDDKDTIESGVLVKVVGIKGNKLIVNKINEER